MARDNFSAKVKETLAKRVGYKCSICGKDTVGPQLEGNGVVSVGEAAHITAASPRGPRYDKELTQEERKDINNGIWLCKNCAREIDRDTKYYTKEVLIQYKKDAEERQSKCIGKVACSGNKSLMQSLYSSFARLEKSRKYFLAYYAENFSSFSCYEICESIYTQHHDLRKCINVHYEYKKELILLLNKHQIEIDENLVEILNKYIDGFSFSYYEDNIGLCSAFYGDFFLMIYKNNIEQAMQARKIVDAFLKYKNSI